jgi:hypothetical protein
MGRLENKRLLLAPLLIMASLFFGSILFILSPRIRSIEGKAMASEHRRQLHAIFWWLAGFGGRVACPRSSRTARRRSSSWARGICGDQGHARGLYFMHLKFERKSLGIIVGSTLILGVILVSVGMAEHWLPRP